MHADALSKVAGKLESLDSQIADTQDLIGALHSMSHGLADCVAVHDPDCCLLISGGEGFHTCRCIHEAAETHCPST